MSSIFEFKTRINELASIGRVYEFLLLLLIPLVILSIPVLVTEQSLTSFYSELFRVTIGSVHGWTLTLVKTVPIFIAGIGVVLAFRTGVWNIGSEGQMAIGAFIGMAVLFSGLSLPGPIMIVLVLISAIVAGGVYAAIAGVLKVKFKVNEILTTLMLNFVALLLVQYGANSLWRSTQGYPFSEPIPSYAELPNFIGQLHVGVFLLIFLFPIAWFILHKSSWGFEFQTAGNSIDVARYSGISAQKAIVLSIFISGAFAGIAGAVELLGVAERLEEGITGPYFGYMAIMAALLARNRLRYLPLTSLFFGAILAAQVSLQVAVSVGIEQLITGIVLLGAIAYYR